MRNGWLLFIAFVAVLSCTQKAVAPMLDESIAAMAYGKQLSWDEISSIIPNQATEEDSAALAERFVNDWLKEQTILRQAELSLSEDEKRFDEELENYRKNLLTFAYENQYVQQRLDTLISAEEIQAYYEENQDIFGLKDYIVKAKFCILESSTPKLKKFRKLFERC